MVNFERLQGVLEHIERNPKNWNQESWMDELPDDEGCGTTYCTAGWAVALYAEPLVNPNTGKEVARTVSNTLFPQLGASLLGLTDVQRGRLFYFTEIIDNAFTCLGQRCETITSGRTGVVTCGSSFGHNRHPNFDELVAQVESTVPGFFYERKIVA